MASVKEFEESLRRAYASEKNVNLQYIRAEQFHKWVLNKYYEHFVDGSYNLDDDEIYELLDGVVKWYHKHGTNAHVYELLDARDKIVTCSYWLSQRLTDAVKKFNARDQLNDIEINRIIDQTSKDIGTHAARSKAKSIKHIELMQAASYKSEISRIERLLTKLDSIDKAIQQRIAWLRQEASKTPIF